MSTQIGVFKHEQLDARAAPGENLVLSLTQPWASLVVMGEKRIETRGWRTSYSGTLLIHASRAFPKWARETCGEPPFKEPVDRWLGRYGELPLGRIIGSVFLVECRPTSYWLERIDPKEKAFGDYGERRYGWLLTCPEVAEYFLPAKGSLGLWKWRASSVEATA